MSIVEIRNTCVKIIGLNCFESIRCRTLGFADQIEVDAMCSKPRFRSRLNHKVLCRIAPDCRDCQYVLCRGFPDPPSFVRPLNALRCNFQNRRKKVCDCSDWGNLELSKYVSCFLCRCDSRRGKYIGPISRRCPFATKKAHSVFRSSPVRVFGNSPGDVF